MSAGTSTSAHRAQSVLPLFTQMIVHKRFARAHHTRWAALRCSRAVGRSPQPLSSRSFRLPFAELRRVEQPVVFPGQVVERVVGCDQKCFGRAHLVALNRGGRPQSGSSAHRPRINPAADGDRNWSKQSWKADELPLSERWFAQAACSLCNDNREEWQY
jgi:hypothetical protein